MVGGNDTPRKIKIPFRYYKTCISWLFSNKYSASPRVRAACTFIVLSNNILDRPLIFSAFLAARF